MLLSPATSLSRLSITATSSSIPHRTGHQPCRAPAHVQPAAVELAGLQQVADLAGGACSRVCSRQSPLALEVRALLDLDKPQATPSEVVTAILKARVDLLWFGGIGTYIRASGESDDQVGDRANGSEDPCHGRRMSVPG